MLETYNYYAEEHTKFMSAFKKAYPEMYGKYGNYISLTEKAGGKAMINPDMPLAPVARAVLNHIIREYYTPIYN